MSTLDLQKLPILTPSELYERLGIPVSLTPLQQASGLDDIAFDRLYRRLLDRYATLVQLSPASENHHHASAGGLLLHTYEVSLYALQRRRGIQLPLGGSVEQIHKERHLWSYAVFCACVLHDIGKPMGPIALIATFEDGEERRWYPHEPPLSDLKAISYRVEFTPVPYDYHHQVALTLFHLIPGIGRTWLSGNTVVMKELTTYLWGDRYESGVIGEIAEFGDRQSTAQNLQIPAKEAVFSNRFSLVSRLLKAARELIGTNDMPINRNGATGWVSEDGVFIYVVCRSFVEKLVNRLHEQGVNQVPTDPLRLYDILMEHGHAIANEGKAVHTIRIEGREFTHVLTCLKFAVRLFFPPTKLPKPFEGTIKEVEASENTQEKENTSKETQDAKRPSPEKRDDGARGVSKDDNESNVRHVETEKEKGGNEKIDEAACADISNENAEIPRDTVEANVENKNQESEKSPEENTNKDVTGVALRQELTIENTQLGQLFFDWLKKNLIEKTILINNRQAVVHIVPEGIFLVAPGAFKEFLKKHGMDENQHKRLSRRFQRLRINIKRNDINIHKYWVVSPNKKTNINGWLVPFDKVYENGAIIPEPNKYFERNCD